ncbi:MAG: hypothetical protein P8J01_00480 [Acidimicrobiales bacterium]|nr:hypothetical protein [Acidimicrobiales bacterium]MDG1844849.1 hypothetical protein [Acidimicrobiales bacterium]
MNYEKTAAAVFLCLVFLGSFACSPDTTKEGLSPFCEELGLLSDTNSALGNLDFDNPSSVDTAISALNELANNAPDDIVENVRSVASLYENILRKLVAVSPNQRASELRKFQSDLNQITPAARALEKYGTTECGIVFISPLEQAPTPLPPEIQN